MEKKKVNSLGAAICYCLCAFVWDIVLVLDFVDGYSSIFSFITHIICTISFNLCAILWLIKYKKERCEIDE